VKSYPFFALCFMLIVVGVLSCGRLWMYTPTVMAQVKTPAKQNPPTSITTCGTVITTPGTYTVRAGPCDGNGVVINSSDVTIEDFGLDTGCIGGCGPTQTGILVFDPAGGPITNVRLLSGSVEDFTIAVSFAGVQESQVTGVFMGNFSTTCLLLNADTDGDPSQDDVFTSNTLTACSGADIAGNSINNSTFIGSQCYGTNAGDTLGVGIQILSGNGNTLTGNTCSGLAVGIELGGTGSTGATGNLLIGNTTTSNATGILVASPANGNTFRENYSINQVLDMDDENAKCGTDIWRRDVFYSASQSCIH